MNAEWIIRAKSTAARIAAVLFWLAVWQALSLAVANDIVLCGPADVASALVRDVGDALFWSSAAATFGSIAAGFSLAFVLGVALGAVGARHSAFETLVAPAVSFLKSVPVVCVIVLLLLWLGSARSVSAVVFLVAFPPVYAAVLEGSKTVCGPLHDAMRVQRVRLSTKVLALWWPHALPFLRAGARSFVGMSWKAGIAAELIGIPAGTLGASLYQAKISLSTADLLACTVAAVLLSAVCERLFLVLLDRSGNIALRIAVARCHRAAEKSSRRGFSQRRFETGRNLLVSVEEAGVSFDNGSSAFSRVSFEVFLGDAVLLDQPSGAGKTTLLEAVCGLRPLTAGIVRRSPGLRLSVVFQQPALIDGLTALDNVLLFCEGAVGCSDIRAMMERVLPAEALDRKAKDLSGGQRRRVELCRALASDSDLVLLDEPFAGLDEASAQDCLTLVDEELCGRALLVATHHPAAKRRWSAKVVVDLR